VLETLATALLQAREWMLGKAADGQQGPPSTHVSARTDALAAAAAEGQVREVVGDLRGRRAVDGEAVGQELVGALPYRWRPVQVPDRDEQVAAGRHLPQAEYIEILGLLATRVCGRFIHDASQLDGPVATSIRQQCTLTVQLIFSDSIRSNSSAKSYSRDTKLCSRSAVCAA